MTEEEWLASTDPESMEPFAETLDLNGFISSADRQLRLYVCGCCRRLGTVLPENISGPVIEVAERFADDCASQVELEEATQCYCHQEYDWLAYLLLPDLRGLAAIGNATDRAARMHPAGFESERRSQSDILRDIFGNPFRAIMFDPGWRTSTAAALAQEMYESHDFSAMPILADALQDAGCDRDDILDHCRGPGPHVRGCWVVDLVLGKE
ncbi:Uncharacterized protein OS=Sorangium cellulosum (strain So ce56) GN=sce5710 PE=4 SV=1 [Gemmata massiliana]|uniref:SMI1/KNR4 family protein n=1 Tax=Gemmata massiliana TaxID=1210884 RepID=A0A6P2D9K1_9BACT|nr:hypothetical protein [Gemmata massiliana]VTR97035.1 Uncharacterized protein OS=Sorangium cellulosum (strain So ce56) GN=sce5710 PE=4 SV=1 [Gemmata massiliana]